MLISNPVNETQRRFNELCEAGGGPGGGPARGKLLAVLRENGQKLHAVGREAMLTNLKLNPDYNPWYVCFAVGLSWGRFAKLEEDFVAAAVRFLADRDSADLREARRHHHERGPDPIERSLRGGMEMFDTVRFPDSIPDDLRKIGEAQQRWFAIVTNKSRRPAFIGSWNSTCMFMMAVMSRPELARSLTETTVLLPPSGPMCRGLDILHDAHILSEGHAGTILDDNDWEPGAIFENNALFADVHRGGGNWSLIDVNNALYLLGTRLAESDNWF